MVGLIRDNNDLSHREQVRQLVDCSCENNLILNIAKTKEMFIDFRMK